MEFVPPGEALALDLVNTRPVVDGERTDLLATPAALGAWLELEAARLMTQVRAPSGAHLAAVLAVREAAESAIRAAMNGSPPPARTLRVLGDTLRQAPAYQELAWGAGRVIAVERRAGAPPARLAAELAASAAELLASDSIDRVRECERPGCVLLFLAANPRRRWCSAARCGNRVRVARYYQRHH